MADCKYVFKLRRGWKYDKDPITQESRDDWRTYEEEQPPGYRIPGAGELVVEYDNDVPRLKIGDGERKFSDLPYISVDSFILPKPATIQLGTQWSKSADDRYYQVVTVQNAVVTPNSKVDLQISPTDLSIFHEKDIAFVAENENGVVRVYCIGQMPQNAYTLQATVTEVCMDA